MRVDLEEFLEVLGSRVLALVLPGFDITVRSPKGASQDRQDSCATRF